MPRKVTITLEQRLMHKRDNVGGVIMYIVKSLTNTVEFDMGEELTRDKVEELCNREGYTVNIK